MCIICMQKQTIYRANFEKIKNGHQTRLRKIAFELILNQLSHVVCNVKAGIEYNTLVMFLIDKISHR